MVQDLRKIWKTSEPEEIGKDPVRFLGMNVKKFQEGEKEVWYVTQEPYIQDLLAKYEDAERKIPITRDQAAMEPEEGSPALEKIRRCQKEVGELLWLVTRSRPDIMFAVARMGANITKAAFKGAGNGITSERILEKDSRRRTQVFSVDRGGRDSSLFGLVFCSRERRKPWKLHHHGQRGSAVLEIGSTVVDYCEHC